MLAGCWLLGLGVFETSIGLVDLPVAHDTDVEDFAGHCEVVVFGYWRIIGEEYDKVKEKLWF